MSSSLSPDSAVWPALPYEEWGETCATLHMWTQIIGKIRLKQTPPLNHSWHGALYLSARGLTTSPIPYGTRVFQIDLDFIDHVVTIATGDGMRRTMELKARPVAGFYRELFTQLADLGLQLRIHGRPNEVDPAIPFEQDYTHASYDAGSANRFWHVLLQTERVFRHFRSSFIGKCSPIHFFWGSFDLAVTRFSGAPAPRHPGGVPNCPDSVMQDAYSHELSSCGFWPGNEAAPTPVFYSYAYPEPPGYKAATVRPAAARYEQGMGEFILPYEAMRRAPSPDTALLEFLQSTYDAAAELGKWDRAMLERPAQSAS
jgi:hypothetical protein